MKKGDELFPAAESLSSLPPIKNNKVAILADGGGHATIAADLLTDLGVELPELSDKTMVDALHPALAAMKQALGNGSNVKQVLQQGAAAAEEGMKNTIPMLAKKGRASYLGERSIGHQDPGATSSYLLLKTAVDVWG